MGIAGSPENKAKSRGGITMASFKWLTPLIVFTIFLSGCSSSQYNDAVAQVESGNYQSALEMFEELGDYKDAENQAAECSFTLSLSEYLDPIIADINTSNAIQDLSYRIEIDECRNTTTASGDIIFLCDDIENLEPEMQFLMCRAISGIVFGGDFAGLNFTFPHGEFASTWESSSGAKYDLSYYSLKKDGKEIYDNPENDLQEELDKYGIGNEGKSGKKYDISSKDDDFWFAVTVAQNLVKGQLKSPSTASFPSSATAYSVQTDGTYLYVSGYVDAQNSFGAELRQNWTASFKMGDTSGVQYKISDYSVTFD